MLGTKATVTLSPKRYYRHIIYIYIYLYLWQDASRERAKGSPESAWLGRGPPPRRGRLWAGQHGGWRSRSRAHPALQYARTHARGERKYMGQHLSSCGLHGSSLHITI